MAFLPSYLFSHGRSGRSVDVPTRAEVESLLPSETVVETLLMGVDIPLPAGVTLGGGEPAGFKKAGGVVAGFGFLDRAAGQATNAVLVLGFPEGWIPSYTSTWLYWLADLTDFSWAPDGVYSVVIGGVAGLEFDSGARFDGSHHQQHGLAGIVYVPVG